MALLFTTLARLGESQHCVVGRMEGVGFALCAAGQNQCITMLRRDVRQLANGNHVDGRGSSIVSDVEASKGEKFGCIDGNCRP